ncbi:MAG TPA: hypothetical protein PLB16_10010 [bacterium]|nr:hypothetical protein [bacterium]
MVYIFKDYGITHGCVIITSGFNNPSRLDSMIARLDNRTAEKCTDPFVIDISKLNENSRVVREINGIKFFLDTVVPEKKEEDSIVDKDDPNPSVKENTNETPVQSQVIESAEDSDIAVYLIKDGRSEGVSVDEIEDAVVNIQSVAGKVDIIITGNAEVSKEKIIKNSTQLINIAGYESFSVVTFSVILQGNGEKVVSLLSRDDFGTLF